jgi:hypothetical protein
MRTAFVALFLFVLAGEAWSADCPLDLGHGTGIVIFSDRYMLALRPDPLRIEIGQPFALLMNVCTKTGEPAELVAVDATLGERTHAAAPTLASGGNGRYRVEGLMLARPGNWEIAFDVRAADKLGGEIQRLTHDFAVK